MNQNKTYVCVVFHHSDLRPEGEQMANNFIKSWNKTQLPFNLVVLDNESTINYECLDNVKHDYIRVEDQIKIGGITGAWNILCKHAIKKGASKIMGFADDVQVNNSLLKFEHNINNDNILYGPLTDGVQPPFNLQLSKNPHPGKIYNTNLLNGFWLGFTRQFWIDKNTNNNLFIEMKNPLIDMWAGQELMLQVWSKKFNTKGLIIGDSWIHHTKIRSWKNARNKYEN